MAIPLFVYGTLLRAASQAVRMAPFRFVGPARTRPAYELVDLGPYPALILGGATAVVGELYEVPLGRLAELDRYEGDDYRRVWVELENGTSAQAYVIDAQRRARAPRIENGSWLARPRREGAVG